MKPLDPRLLRWARSTRSFLLSAVVLGVAQAFVVIAQASLIATVVTRLFLEQGNYQVVAAEIKLLIGVALARALVVGGTEYVAGVAGTKAKKELRQALVERLIALGPVRTAKYEPAEIAVLGTKGIDALDAYFARYLPQLALAATVPPVIGLTVLGLDTLATITIALTVPLIPVFMILVGWYTQTRVDKQWATLRVLSNYFMDVVSGLPTLAIFGRAKQQVKTLGEVTDDYRVATMGVLRISFLSALVLELLSTLSVALVAVGIGIRLVEGGMDFRAGLLVLILAPEAYLPLRMVGVHFHAAAEGLGAAQRILDVLSDEQVVPPALSGTEISLRNVHAGYDDHLVLKDLSATIPAHRVTAITGASGVGKSTLLNVLMGFITPTQGQMHGPVRDDIAYVSQRPYLRTGSLRQAVDALNEYTDEQVVHALESAGLSLDLQTPVGEGGGALSIGQRRRAAFARALLKDAPVVILDEPTAALDESSEDDVIAAIQTLRAQGRTVVVVAHRPKIVDLADHVVAL